MDYITDQLPLGWLIFGIHRYNASALRIFFCLFTRAVHLNYERLQKAPRIDVAVWRLAAVRPYTLPFALGSERILGNRDWHEGNR